jgi:hypothetical protein
LLLTWSNGCARAGYGAGATQMKWLWYK